MVHPLIAYNEIRARQKDSWGQVTFYAYKQGFRQKKPYVVWTPLDSAWYERSPDSDVPSVNATSWEYQPQEPPSWAARALVDANNQCNSRFVNNIGDASSFGATLTAERRETWATVVTLITKATKAARQVAGFRFADAARTLGLPYKEYTKRVRVGVVRRGRRRKVLYSPKTVFDLPNGRTVVKTAASGWLLYSYGVKPLCQDIYNGMDVLQRPLPYHRVRSSGRGNASQVISDKPYAVLTKGYSVSVSYSAEVTVDNPNLYLANKLGLTNPAQWVLEGIPFSFVVDWFSNLSAVVNSMTDLQGLRLSKSLVSYNYVSTEVRTPLMAGQTRYGKTRNVNLRSPGGSLPPVRLTFGYERFSWQRGLNAISLLVGFLPSKAR